MARIRSIKPEFPQSESIGRLSRDARLLFMQIWTIVDDEGRARAASRMLASLLYPYDDDASKLIDHWLGELEREGHIRLYEVETSRYLDIPNWLKHQKIDRPSKSRLPEYREHSTKPREESRALDADLGPRTLDMDLGPRTGERTRSRATRLDANWTPSRDGTHFAVTELGNQEAAFRELEKFRDYWCAKSGQQAAKTDWEATWRNWVRTAIERRGKPNGTEKSSLGEVARGLASEVREREREAGIIGSDAPVRGH